MNFPLEAVVLQHEASKGRYAMSAKRSLVEAALAGKLPRVASEVRPQQFLQGFVRGVEDYGVFVSFLGGFSALAPKGNLSQKPIESVAEMGFFVGQSVRCCVVSVDADKSRVSITLKPNLCMCPDAAFLSSLLADQALLALAKTYPEPSTLPTPPFGAVVSAVVKAFKPDGCAFTLEGRARGFCPKASLDAAGIKPNPGKSIKCVVLDVDAPTSHVVRLIPESSTSLSFFALRSTRHSNRVGQYRCSVQSRRSSRCARGSRRTRPALGL